MVNSTSHRKIPPSLAQLLLRRLLLAYIAFAFAITGIQMFIEYRVTKGEVINNLQSLARDFSPGAESALWELQETLLDTMVNGIGANPAVVRVEIRDTDGNLSASWQSPSKHQPSPTLTVQQILYHDDGSGKKQLGTLRIASSDDVLTSRLEDTFWSVGITTSAIFLCLGLILWLLARSLIVRPLVVFSEQVGALAVSGQTKPIDLGRLGAGEIETLRLGFNRLMQQLNESLGRIAEQNILLQQEKTSLKRESEKNLALLHNASDGIHILDAEGNLIEASDSFCAMLGYAREELLGMSVVKWDAGRFETLPNQSIQQRFPEMVRTQFETIHRRKDGTVFDVEVSGFPLELDGKQVFFYSARDISERKQAEKRSEIMLRRQQALMQSALEGIHIMDMNGDIVEVNETFCKLLGYTRDEAAKLNVADWDAQWSREELMERFRLLSRMNSAFFETRHRRKDGTLIDVEVSTTGTELDGKYYLYASSRDISERKQFEAALKRESEKNLALLRNASDGIHILDTEGNVIEASDSFCSMLGYRREEVIGMNVSRWDASQTEIKQGQIIQQSKTPARRQFETRHRRKDGTVFDVEVSGFPLELDGKPVFFYSSRDISERKEAEEKIQHLAFFDQLTHIPNRQLLLDRLNQALLSSTRSNRRGSLLFIDLDNFKNLNDTLGHDIGDMLLQQVSQHLESSLREGDTVARLGGDEFVVMLLDLSELPFEAAAQSEAIAEKILAALNRPYQLGPHAYRCTASIGITLFSGNQQSTDELMKQADIAMYQAKKAGRNTLRFFDQEMQENISARVLLESELQNALEFRQFQLYYQIQVDSSHRPLGAEALIRWLHPARGLVPPAQFISLAEETGMILPIGLWVLDTACAQLKAWQQDPRTRDLTLAVNVSARQFRQPDFVAQVQSAVRHHTINPKLLKLELTESLLQENIEDTIGIMTALNEIDIQFALDDFGTGYSSLQYLKRLPLDQIKIDRSFVHDIATDVTDIAVVRATIAMARSLALDVIAEGVETEEQRQLLLENGCLNYQGFLFGRPTPIEDFNALLDQGRSSP